MVDDAFDKAQITLMAEWLGSPFWITLDGEFEGDLPIDEIGELVDLSPELIKEIAQWDKTYQDTYNPKYQPDGGFKTEEEEERFISLGRRLAHKLRAECPPNITIVYAGYGTLEEVITMDDSN